MAALMAVLLSLAATGLPGRERFRLLLRASTTFSYRVMACMVMSRSWYPFGRVPTTSSARFSLAGARTVTRFSFAIFNSPHCGIAMPFSSKKARMRFMASVRCSTEYAYDTRQYPSPEAPKASPGTSATCFCSSSRVQNS